MMSGSATGSPLITHIVYRFGIGGLENGLVNLLNGLDPDQVRHAIVSLTTIDPAFAARIQRPGVELIAIDKRPGQTVRAYPAVYRALRRLRPAIVHSHNLAALECQPVAWLARVPHRLHGEHGWDMSDLHGTNRRYLQARRVLKRFVHRQIALSVQTRDYLADRVGVPGDRLSLIPNGVDTSRFRPALPRADRLPWPWNDGERTFCVGTIGRLTPVKNQKLLCDAFAMLAARNPAFRAHGRLALIGDGPDRPMLERIVANHALGPAVWFAGDRSDVPALLQHIDVFCLTSHAEGMSNAILEAMACGIPVIATQVGGNAELVVDGETGRLLAEPSAAALADAIEGYFSDPGTRQRHGSAAGARARTDFSIATMVERYWSEYARLLGLPAGPAGTR